jgi:hypothetical protein
VEWNEHLEQFRVPRVHWVVESENKPSMCLEGRVEMGGINGGGSGTWDLGLGTTDQKKKKVARDPDPTFHCPLTTEMFKRIATGCTDPSSPSRRGTGNIGEPGARDDPFEMTYHT